MARKRMTGQFIRNEKSYRLLKFRDITGETEYNNDSCRPRN
jgi:hypothetical protein